MRQKLLAAIAVLLSFAPLPARADPGPGDACPTANMYAISAGPENSGVGYLMVCQGGTWQPVMTFNNTAQVTKIGNQTCATSEILKFDGTKWACAADGGGGGPACPDGDSQIAYAGGWICSSAYDLTPDVFSFTDQTNVALSTFTASNIVQITGIAASAATSITGGGTPQYRICSDSGCSTEVQTWTTGAATIDNNQYLQLRLTSSASYSTMLSTTVTVGTGSDQWDVTTLAGSDPCAGSPSPGDVCANGSVYAGQSPDGNVAMYTTPADAGAFTWNNGGSNWVDTAMSNSSYITGEAHTTFLVGLSNSESPYAAAAYCDALSAHGETDWYLPARNELTVLYTNRVAIGGFNTSGSNPAGLYWSSSEGCNDCAWYKNFNSGSQTPDWKDYGLSVRCVRKD